MEHVDEVKMDVQERACLEAVVSTFKGYKIPPLNAAGLCCKLAFDICRKCASKEAFAEMLNGWLDLWEEEHG